MVVRVSKALYAILVLIALLLLLMAMNPTHVHFSAKIIYISNNGSLIFLNN